MPSARRSKLIESTITVLGPGDREELANLSRLRRTLFAASLQDLRKIEANFKNGWRTRSDRGRLRSELEEDR